MKNDFLSEKVRAEDIILGSLGFGEEAHIVSIDETKNGFKGIGSFEDGENFEFESTDKPSPLELWALKVLIKNLHS